MTAAAAASLAVLPAYAAAGEKVQILPLLAVVAAAAALCALDIFAGRPLAQRMARRMKTVNIVLLAALALVAAVVVLAVNWTGPIDMAAVVAFAQRAKQDDTVAARMRAHAEAAMSWTSILRGVLCALERTQP